MNEALAARCWGTDFHHHLSFSRHFILEDSINRPRADLGKLEREMRVRRLLVAVAMLMCSMSALASGNYNCQISGTLQGGGPAVSASGTASTAVTACLQAAKVVTNTVVGWFSIPRGGSCNSAPITDYPYPLRDDGNSACVGTCGVGDDVNWTNSVGSRCDANVRVTANSQIGTGTSWGPQYGSTHTYDSIAGTSPDVITYMGPEDGNMSIEIDANQGLNSTAISAVSVTDWLGGSVGTVTHAHTSPDVWLVSGSVRSGSSYSVDVTFSHTGGYGEYAVKMAPRSATLLNTWSPVLTFGGSSTGITYTDQEAQYEVIGNFVLVHMRLAINSVGTATGNAQVTLPLPENQSILGHVFAIGFWNPNTSLSGSPLIVVDSGVGNLEQTSGNGNQWITNANFKSGSVIAIDFWYIQ